MEMGQNRVCVPISLNLTFSTIAETPKLYHYRIENRIENSGVLAGISWEKLLLCVSKRFSTLWMRLLMD